MVSLAYFAVNTYRDVSDTAPAEVHRDDLIIDLLHLLLLLICQLERGTFSLHIECFWSVGMIEAGRRRWQSHRISPITESRLLEGRRKVAVSILESGLWGQERWNLHRVHDTLLNFHSHQFASKH